MKSILLVDDNPDLRELVAVILGREGYDVHEAENGKEALERLETMDPQPSLMLLDLMMPVMNGQEVLQALSERNRLETLPVVVLSAGGHPAQAPAARVFIRKPADPQALIKVVRDICGPARGSA